MLLQCLRFLITATFALLGLLAALAVRLPRALRERYLASFESRHGVGVMIGLTVLATVVLATLVATLLHPGHALAELVNALAVAALTFAAVLDLTLFARG